MKRRPSNEIKTSLDKRILNEFASKILNEERVEKVTGMRKRANQLDPFLDTIFHCECDDQDCEETIKMSTELYARLHKKTKQFTVIPDHVRHDIEDVGEKYPSFVVVEKYFPYPKSLTT